MIKPGERLDAAVRLMLDARGDAPARGRSRSRSADRRPVEPRRGGHHRLGPWLARRPRPDPRGRAAAVRPHHLRARRQPQRRPRRGAGDRARRPSTALAFICVRAGTGAGRHAPGHDHRWSARTRRSRAPSSRPRGRNRRGRGDPARAATRGSCCSTRPRAPTSWSWRATAAPERAASSWAAPRRPRFIARRSRFSSPAGRRRAPFPERILVATDGSADAERAVELTARIGKPLPLPDLYVLNVEPIPHGDRNGSPSTPSSSRPRSAPSPSMRGAPATPTSASSSGGRRGGLARGRRQPRPHRRARAGQRQRARGAPRPLLGARRSPGVIDLHCHILPALDDGALDLDDAVAMARQAQADGIAGDLRDPPHPARPRRRDRRAVGPGGGGERRARKPRRAGSGWPPEGRWPRPRYAVSTTRSCGSSRSAAAGAGSCSNPRPAARPRARRRVAALAARGFRQRHRASRAPRRRRPAARLRGLADARRPRAGDRGDPGA